MTSVVIATSGTRSRISAMRRAVLVGGVAAAHRGEDGVGAALQRDVEVRAEAPVEPARGRAASGVMSCACSDDSRMRGIDVRVQQLGEQAARALLLARPAEVAAVVAELRAGQHDLEHAVRLARLHLRARRRRSARWPRGRGCRGRCRRRRARCSPPGS